MQAADLSASTFLNVGFSRFAAWRFFSFNLNAGTFLLLLFLSLSWRFSSSLLSEESVKHSPHDTCPQPEDNDSDFVFAVGSGMGRVDTVWYVPLFR